jgi:hypothetical protein
MEYITLVCLAQTEAGPVMASGFSGTPITAMHFSALLPQALTAFTQMLPETNVDAKVTVIVLVFCPLFMDVPAGSVQE